MLVAAVHETLSALDVADQKMLMLAAFELSSSCQRQRQPTSRARSMPAARAA